MTLSLPEIPTPSASPKPPSRTFKKSTDTADLAFHNLQLATNNSNHSAPSPTRGAILKDVEVKVKSYQHRRNSITADISGSGKTWNNPATHTKWSEKFSAKKTKSFGDRQQVRDDIIMERKAYRPLTVDSSWLEDESELETKLHPMKWDNRFGVRNSNCLYCWKGVSLGAFCNVCSLCPAVAHMQCTEGKNRGDSLSAEQGWRCYNCVQELDVTEESERVRIQEVLHKRAFFFAALKCQAYLLMQKERMFFRKKKRGIIRLQGVVLGIRQRKKFMKDVTNTYRSFRFKIGEFKGLRSSDPDGKPCDPVCITSIFNNNKSIDLDEAERQMYRFDTTTMQKGFTIFSLNCRVDLAFTVVDKDDIGRCNFLGQNTFDGGPVMKPAILSGRKAKLKLPLKFMEIEPRETSNRQPIRMDGLNSEPTGRIGVEIQPVSNIVNKVGPMEEMLSALLNGAKKKWWVVLIDRMLLLFSHQGDMRPKHEIPLKLATVTWHEKVVIKVQLTEKTWFLVCASWEDRLGWYNKITNKYNDTLERGTQSFKLANGYFRTKGEEKVEGGVGDQPEPAED